MQVGEKIKKFRSQKKITQSQMAIDLEISQRAYSKIENNEVQIKLDRLQKIADILDVDAREILPDNGAQHFEIVNYSQISCEKVVNQTSSIERKLYDDIIKRQQEEIIYLKELIRVIKKQ